jgi:diadenosine tetraphosphate (Ap4A) HIT family hydrolase
MSIFSEKSEIVRLYQDEYFFIIEDKYPVNHGHLLIVSHREVVDFFDLTIDERSSLVDVIITAKQIIEESYEPSGYNIGMNCGVAAGQTVMHFHCHVIPRYIGDTPNPRGGIRNCIPEKGDY